MRHIDKEDLVQHLLPIARLAGDAIMAIYSREIPEVQLKEDDTPVTEADLAAHQVLSSHLKPLLFQCPVVSEEDAGSLVHRKSTGRFLAH